MPTPAELRHPHQARDSGEGPRPDAAAEPEGRSSSPQGHPPASPAPLHVVADTQPRHPDPTDRTPTPASLPRPAKPPAPRQEALPATPEPSTRGRILPNPATLMAAGRGGRKVRTPGLRARRLPKVEETSAGGVVLDLTCRPAAVALIARHDRRSRLLWSLPKGHVEAGETPEQAALREVFEETGLVGRIVAPLGIIDFWFVVEDKRIHKTVHHFVIEAIGGELSDEDIEVEAVEWIPFDQVVRRLAYGDERRLVEKVAQIVPGVR